MVMLAQALAAGSKEDESNMQQPGAQMGKAKAAHSAQMRRQMSRMPGRTRPKAAQAASARPLVGPSNEAPGRVLAEGQQRHEATVFL